MQIAIDGPAGSGKSTVCKLIADKYGFTYIDTGAMYRSVTWFAETYGYDNLAHNIEKVNFLLSDGGKSIAVEYNGEETDVTDIIRTPEISSKVASVASNKDVRAVLVKKQQDFAEGHNVIMEGRDITTVVLPNAEIKIYLTATAEERAKRRFEEWKKQGKTDMPDYDEVLEEIKKRDEMDSTRHTSPLVKADDAELIDTTGLTLEQVADKIGSMLKKLLQ